MEEPRVQKVEGWLGFPWTIRSGRVGSGLQLRTAGHAILVLLQVGQRRTRRTAMALFSQDLTGLDGSHRQSANPQELRLPNGQ
jgi:hypothetical protein